MTVVLSYIMNFQNTKIKKVKIILLSYIHCIVVLFVIIEYIYIKITTIIRVRVNPLILILSTVLQPDLQRESTVRVAETTTARAWVFENAFW